MQESPLAKERHPNHRTALPLESRGKTSLGDLRDFNSQMQNVKLI